MSTEKHASPESRSTDRRESAQTRLLSLERQSVDYVFGIISKPCVRYGPSAEYPLNTIGRSDQRGRPIAAGLEAPSQAARRRPRRGRLGSVCVLGLNSDQNPVNGASEKPDSYFSPPHSVLMGTPTHLVMAPRHWPARSTPTSRRWHPRSMPQTAPPQRMWCAVRL